MAETIGVEIAGAPTIDKEVPVDSVAATPSGDDPEIEEGEEISRDAGEALDEDPAVERAKDGTARAEDSGVETNPSAVG